MTGDGATSFSCEGSATNDGWMIWLVVLGGVGSLTGVIVSLAAGSEWIGPWWAYALGLMAVIALGAYSMQASAVRVEVERDGVDRRLRITGRGASVDALLSPKVRRWQYGQALPLKQGGGTMWHFALIASAADGRTLCFRQMGGQPVEGWPRGDGPLGEGPDIFIVVDIDGLARAIEIDPDTLGAQEPA